MHETRKVSYLSGWRVPVVEVLFVRVHPDLCSSDSILEEVGPRVRGFFREHMSHVRAGMNLQAAPTLPHLRVADMQLSKVKCIYIAPF